MHVFILHMSGNHLFPYRNAEHHKNQTRQLIENNKKILQASTKKWVDDNHIDTNLSGIILLGRRGVGKSTIASSITGIEFKSGVSRTAVTTELCWAKNRKYVVFDIPGFTQKDNGQTKMLHFAINCCHQLAGISAIIMVDKLDHHFNVKRLLNMKNTIDTHLIDCDCTLKSFGMDLVLTHSDCSESKLKDEIDQKELTALQEAFEEIRWIDATKAFDLSTGHTVTKVTSVMFLYDWENVWLGTVMPRTLTTNNETHTDLVSTKIPTKSQCTIL